jgi:hypothetical protein
MSIYKKAATANLKVYIKDEDKILKQKLDKLMLQFKETEPAFYTAYKNDRKVIDLGTHHTRVGGIVSHNNGIPEDDVTISVEGTDFIKITNDEGAYLFKPFFQGTFDFKAEKSGFIPQIINREVARGENVHLNFELVPVTQSGGVGSGLRVNAVNTSNQRYRAGATVRVKNTSPLSVTEPLLFYLANNPVDAYSGSEGIILLPGEDEVHTIVSGEFRPYLNVQNDGGEAGTFEITIL